MRLKEIKEMSDENLLAAFYWAAVRTTNEANSMRGLTQKSVKEENWIIAEIEKRFNVSIKERINDK